MNAIVDWSKIMQEKTDKSTISAKIPIKMKEELIERAKAEGKTTSEFVASILAEQKQKEEQHDQEIAELKGRIEEQAGLILALTDRLEKEQILLSQQQELQLMAQRQIEEMRRSNQLLLEAKTERKWWQIWTTTR